MFCNIRIALVALVSALCSPRENAIDVPALRPQLAGSRLRGEPPRRTRRLTAVTAPPNAPWTAAVVGAANHRAHGRVEALPASPHRPVAAARTAPPGDGFALPSCGPPGVGLLADQDADASTDNPDDGRADGDRSCTFTVGEPSDGGTVTCRSEPGSLAACTDVAECICRARSPAAERMRIDECIGRELTPRAMIALSDFCPGTPAHDDLDEALRGYYGSLGAEDHVWVSARCAAIPALAGSAPYAECVMLSDSYCRCIPGICDADILVRRRCADLSRDQVLCIYARITEEYEHACELDIAAIVADCIDPAT